jgi:hypothetical protein
VTEAKNGLAASSKNGYPQLSDDDTAGQFGDTIQVWYWTLNNFVEMCKELKINKMECEKIAGPSATTHNTLKLDVSDHAVRR